MSRKIVSLLKQWTPPALYDLIFQISGSATRYSGPVSDWETALSRSSGYDDEEIIEKTLNAAIKVKNGEAAFERDSVTFNKIELPFPVLACILRAASANDNQISILDFGGSLGSSYFQCKDFLSELELLKWSIVEQPALVSLGNKLLSDPILSFHESVTDACDLHTHNVFLASGTIQYLRHPYQALTQFIEILPEYIILDRTPCSDSGSEFVVIQHPPESIYSASYPLWILSESNIISFLSEYYKMVATLPCSDRPFKCNTTRVTYKGFLFKKCKN